MQTCKLTAVDSFPTTASVLDDLTGTRQVDGQ